MKSAPMPNYLREMQGYDHEMFITVGIPRKERIAIIEKRLRSRCRKSSKSSSNKHTWLISHCDKNGNAVCSFCQISFKNQ